MEVCGTHTMAIGRFGLRKLLPENIRLISGPGCPVCVTPAGYIDQAVELARREGMTIATFGDMVRVPGHKTSLEQARAEGVSVQVILSPAEIVSPGRKVLFLATGFETTAAPIVATLARIAAENIKDVYFYTSLKVIPPTLRLLLADTAIGVDGFILPGHVSAVIGSRAYGIIKIPAVIAGFELLDILQAIRIILEQKLAHTAETVNPYTRVVTPDGNTRARELFERYLEPSDQLWRGLGKLPGCSLRIKKEFGFLDAEQVFNLPLLTDKFMPAGCSCGLVLQGKIAPPECPLFATTCTPENPVGPCMVSSEGSCAAHFRYERGSGTP
jgi:hydrogenase expression/formation protein HypD